MHNKKTQPCPTCGIELQLKRHGIFPRHLNHERDVCIGPPRAHQAPAARPQGNPSEPAGRPAQTAPGAPTR